MSREEMIIQEIQLYLSSFKVAHGRLRMTAEDKMEMLDRGIRRYFVEYPEEWEPLAEYIEAGWEEDEWGLVLERLLVPELVLGVHRFLREEMDYAWLTNERFFAYEYSF